ncbi:MAG: sn-glycerol-3-phosphate ABC transporter ATP-binding protein UgpC [Candidatus Hydrogenedentota bacterium]|nr:MAG: sn-glycerol-3-phosphate ABC transporter ATP-binding protein UgpC [Candidatus Hydrogenedentota bacterium]
MAALILKNLSKFYKKGAVGVRNLNVEVCEGELMVLVGPSGSGKSTTLRLIAGLETPTEGDVYIGGRRANDVPPRDRDIAMVFQDYALYPHLNVAQNLGFGLKMRGFSKHQVRSRVMGAASMLGISELLERKPKELSGGQRQRVALGRALVRNPKVFLFDEPLSNLDASLRVQVRQEIKQIHRRLGATMVYVTHDQNEAMTMGQRMIVINAGFIEQVGSPAEIYRRPESKFVAGFFGSPAMNFAECIAEANTDGLEIRCGDFKFLFKPQSARRFDNISRRVVLGFRPEDVRLAEAFSDDSLTGLARVLSVEAMGAETVVYLEIGPLRPVARVLGYAEIKPGTEIPYYVPNENLHFFDAETGKRIQI